eukprot:1535235-Amphidinium_carterae.1
MDRSHRREQQLSTQFTCENGKVQCAVGVGLPFSRCQKEIGCSDSELKKVLHSKTTAKVEHAYVRLSFSVEHRCWQQADSKMLSAFCFSCGQIAIPDPQGFSEIELSSLHIRSPVKPALSANAHKHAFTKCGYTLGTCQGYS